MSHLSTNRAAAKPSTRRFKRPSIRAIVTSFIATLCASAATADTLDVSLGGSTARGEYQGQFAQHQDLYYGGHLLYHEDDGHVLGASLHVAGRSKATTLSQHTGIGGKLIQFDGGDPDGAAIAVGGYILHNLATANLLSVRGDLYYAPSVVTFGDGQSYFEFNLRMEYKLVNQASVYLGYRNIEVDFDKFGNKDIEESGHVGLIMHF